MTENRLSVSTETALDMCCQFILDNKTLLKGEILNMTDKKQVLEFVVKNYNNSALSGDNAFEINIESVVDIVRADFCKYNYNRRFDRTATKKKITSALKSTKKDKRLYSYQIIFAFRKYLRECYSRGTDSQFVKLASSFMTNMVYDYAEIVNEPFESIMVATYGENWRKVKFIYT